MVNREENAVVGPRDEEAPVQTDFKTPDTGEVESDLTVVMVAGTKEKAERDVARSRSIVPFVDVVRSRTDFARLRRFKCVM